MVGELRRHFRDKTWSVRVSRRLKDLHLELKAASEQLSHDLGRAPTVDELADALDTTPEEVLEALEAGAAYRPSSLTAGPTGGEADAENTPGADDPDMAEPGDRAVVQKASTRQPEAQRRGIRLRVHPRP